MDANALSLVPHRPELVPYVLDPPVEPRLDPIDNARRSQVSEVDVARVPGVVEELLSDPVSVGGVGAGGQFRLDLENSKNRSVCSVGGKQVEQTPVSGRYLDGSPRVCTCLIVPSTVPRILSRPSLKTSTCFLIASGSWSIISS